MYIRIHVYLYLVRANYDYRYNTLKKKKCNPINTQIWLISTLISLFKQTVKIQYD